MSSMSSDNQRTPAPLPGDRKPEFNGPETPLTIHIPPGTDPRQEPLLSHAGLVWEEGSPVRFTLDGLHGPSEHRRQFVTNLRNDMTPELLSIMVDRFNDPAQRPQTVSPEEARVETICEV